MNVSVQVTDSSDRPIENAEVHVSWVGGGHSDRRTNRNGIADLECSPGTAESIRVNGQHVLGRMWLDGLISVKANR